MALPTSEFASEGGSREKKPLAMIPAGTHVAVIIGYGSVGTHKDTFGGTEKLRKKIHIIFEVPKIVDEYGNVRQITYEENAFLTTNSNFVQKMGGFLGEKMKPQNPDSVNYDEQTRFFSELGDLIKGKTCLISVTHATKKDGSKKEVIASVAAKIDGMPDIVPSIEPYEFVVNPEYIEQHWGKFNAFTKYAIKNSIEYAKFKEVIDEADVKANAAYKAKRERQQNQAPSVQPTEEQISDVLMKAAQHSIEARAKEKAAPQSDDLPF